MSPFWTLAIGLLILWIVRSGILTDIMTILAMPPLTRTTTQQSPPGMPPGRTVIT